MEALKGLLDHKELIAQIINFLLLLTILRVFLWKKILAAIDQRKERIANDLKRVEDVKKEAEQFKSEYEAKLRSIEAAAAQRINEAVSEGKRKAEEIHRQAVLEAQKAIDHGNAEIRFQIVRAKQELKEQAIQLSINAAEHLVEKNFSSDDDKKVVRDFIDRIDRASVG